MIANAMHWNEEDESEERPPIARRQFRLRRGKVPVALAAAAIRIVVGRPQIFLAAQIDDDGEQHPDAGRGETIMPADFSPSVPTISGESDDAGIDAEIENLKRVGAAKVFRLVE